MKSMLVFGAIIGVYALYETLSGENPYIKFINKLDLYSNDNYITDVRYGFKRCQSLFDEHSLSACVTLCISSTLLYLKHKAPVVIKNNEILFISSILLCLATLFSGVRSAIIAMFICLLMFINNKNIIYISFILLITLIMSDVTSYFSEIINSILHTDAVGGSSTELRNTQFALGIHYWLKSFWFGNGIGYAWEYVRYWNTNEAAGLESIWLQIMIDQGLLGIISYLFFFIQTIFYVWKNKNTKIILFVIGLFTFGTMTSIPHFPITMLFVYVLIMIYSESKNKEFLNIK